MFFGHKWKVLFDELKQVISPDGVTHRLERHITWHVERCKRCGTEYWRKVKDESFEQGKNYSVVETRM